MLAYQANVDVNAADTIPATTMASNARHVVNMANSIVGVSILSVPYCFKETGLVLGMLTVLTCGFITKKTSMFLIRSAIMTRRRSYEFLAFHVFGVSGKLFVELCMILFLIGICISFHVVMGDLAPAIIAKVFSMENTPALRCTLLIGVAVLIILPLCLLRNLDSLSSMSATSIGFYFFLVSVILVHALPKLLDGSWLHTVELWKPKGLFQVFPIISLALACQSNVFEIYDSLVDPDVIKMRNVVTHAVNLCCGLYIAVGFLGYVAFADKDFGGNIVMSFPGSELTEFIKLFFAVSLAISFPLMIFPCRTSIHSLLYRRSAQTSFDLVGNYMPETRFKGITLGILTISLIIGIMIPNIEFVLGLLGSTMGMTIALILPSLMFIKVNSKASTERLVAQGIMFIGAFLIVTGTYLNLKNISDSDAAQRPVVLPDLPKQNLDSPNVDGNALEKNVGGLLQKRIDIVEDKPHGLDKGQQNSNEVLVDDLGKKIADSATRKEPVAPEPPPDINEKVKAADPVKEVKVEVAENKVVKDVVKDVVKEKPKEKEVVNVEEKSVDDLHPDAIEKEEKENKEEIQREDEEKQEFENKQDTILQKIEEQNKQQEEIIAQQKKILEELKKSKDPDVEGRRQEDQPQAKRLESVGAPLIVAAPSIPGIASGSDVNVGGLAGQVKDQVVPGNAPSFQQGVVGVQSQVQNIPPAVPNVQSNIVQPVVLSAQNPVQSGNVQPNLGQQPVVVGVQNSVPSNNMQPVVIIQNPQPNQAGAQQLQGNVQNVPLNWNNPQQSQQNIPPNQPNLHLKLQNTVDLQNSQVVQQGIPLQQGVLVQPGVPLQQGVPVQSGIQIQSGVLGVNNLVPNANAWSGGSQSQYVQANVPANMVNAQGSFVIAQAGMQGVQAGVQNALAGVQGAQAGVQVAQAGVQGAQAGVQGAQAGMQSAQAAQAGVQSAQAGVQGAQTGMQSAQAGVQGAQAGMQSAQAGVQVAQAGVQSAQAGVQGAQAGVQNAQAGVGNAQANVAIAQVNGPDVVLVNAAPEFRSAAVVNPGVAAGHVPAAAAGQGSSILRSEVGEGVKQPDKFSEAAKIPNGQQNLKPVSDNAQPSIKIDLPEVQEEKPQKKDVNQLEKANQGSSSKSLARPKSSSANTKASKVDGSGKPSAVTPNSVKSQGSIPEVDKNKKKGNKDFDRLGNGPVMNRLQNKGNMKGPSKLVAKESVDEEKKKKVAQQEDPKKKVVRIEDQKKKALPREDQKKNLAQKEDKKQLVQKKEEQKKQLAQKEEEQKKLVQKKEEQKKQLTQKEEQKKLLQKEKERKVAQEKGKKVAQHDEERKKRGALQDDLGDFVPAEEQNEVPENNPYNFNLPNVDLNRDLKRRSVGDMYDTRHLLWNREGTDKKYRGTM